MYICMYVSGAPGPVYVCMYNNNNNYVCMYVCMYNIMHVCV